MHGKILLFLCIGLYADWGSTAGFDCAKAATRVEKAICASSELSRLDEHLSAYYGFAKDALRESEACFKADQMQWLKSVRNACKDNACLKKAYLNRLSELDGFQPGATALKYINLPSVTTLAWIVPPLEEDPSPGIPKAALEVTGKLIDELVTGNGYVLRTKSGTSYLLILAGLLGGMTTGYLPALVRQENSTFTARGYAAKDENGEIYFDPSRCIFIYRTPE